MPSMEQATGRIHEVLGQQSPVPTLEEMLEARVEDLAKQLQEAEMLLERIRGRPELQETLALLNAVTRRW